VLSEVAPSAKAALVVALLGRKASPSTVAILSHLVQSPRGRRIGELVRTAANIVADVAGDAVATITTATPLTAQQQERLGAVLAAKYGRTLRLDLIVDPTVVGGIRAQVGDEVVDSTIAARLSDLRLQLAR
jgi:F-type H+-transporting ATPase subunit delta